MSDAILRPLSLLLPRDVLDALAETGSCQGRSAADTAAHVLAKRAGTISPDLPSFDIDRTNIESGHAATF